MLFQKFFLFLGPVILLSCSLLPKKEITQIEGIAVKEYDLHPGFVKKVKLKSHPLFQKASLYCDGKKQGMGKGQNGNLVAYIAADYKSEKNFINCFLKSKIDERTTLNFHVFRFKLTPYDYPFNKLNVPKKHVDLSEKDLNRWLGEQKILKEVYSNAVIDRALFDEEFTRPLKSKVTSVYGTKRIFNNKKESWHSGVDFRARRPTPIPVSNDGKVVFAGDLFFNGKTVIVDHGMGIMTLYCHLSKIRSKVGDLVKKGQVVGKSGNTGRSSAPHLHWGASVQGHWVNGLELIKQSKL